MSNDENDKAPEKPYPDPVAEREYHQQRLCRDISLAFYIKNTILDLQSHPENAYLVPELERQMKRINSVLDQKKEELIKYSDA